MGQKIHPTGFRLSVTKNWASRWFAKSRDFAGMRIPRRFPDHGIGAIEHHTGKETRSLVLGHLQRGGSPTTYDRLLALRFGAAAVRAIADRAFGIMVGLNGSDITRVALENIVGRAKNLPLDSDTVRTARDLGISLGD